MRYNNIDHYITAALIPHPCKSFFIILIGYLLGRIRIKGVGLGTAGVFIIALLFGVMSGALTSTPAFSAAKATAATVASGAGSVLSVADAEALVSVGYGIAYIFGVIGVVLFVQLIPKITGANMEEERAKISILDTGAHTVRKKRFEVEPQGMFVFAFVIVAGILIGAIRTPLTNAGFSGATFSLTSTGGVLLASLVVGHFGHIGPFANNLSRHTMATLRELGLILFLVGAGVSGGMKFVQYFKWIYFFYGIFITLIPMFIGYLFTKHILKMSLLNNLGSITGGMTSTPALGTLIATSGTDDVASAYAATYPIALIGSIICSQFLILLLS